VAPHRNSAAGRIRCPQRSRLPPFVPAIFQRVGFVCRVQRADAELAAGGRPEGDDLRMFARRRRRFADRLRALITEPILKRPED